MARFIASPNTSFSDPDSSAVGGSFSFYLGSKDTNQDGEIGVFGAEKYFNGGMDAENPRMLTEEAAATKHQPCKKHDQSKAPSIRSESTCDSQSKLLHNPLRIGNPPRRKNFFPSLGCNCYRSEKSSAKIDEPIIHSIFLSRKMLPKEAIKASIEIGPLDRTTETHLHKERGGEEASMGGFGSPVFESRGDKVLSFGRRRLTLFDSNGDNDIDCQSDASSDLFEIESLSVSDKLKLNPGPFLARQQSESGVPSGSVTPRACYAPSEASIEWSVATASAADFSAMSDSEERGNVGKGGGAAAPTAMGRETQWLRPGMLLGSCKSLKAVSVAGSGAPAANAGRAIPDQKACRGQPEILRTVKRIQAEDHTSRQRERDLTTTRSRSHLLYIQ